jgi:hypothetical protein
MRNINVEVKLKIYILGYYYKISIISPIWQKELVAGGRFTLAFTLPSQVLHGTVKIMKPFLDVTPRNRFRISFTF